MCEDQSQEFSKTRGINHSAERHRALLELNNAIITNLTEETLLGAICVALKSVIHFDQAGLSIYEPEQEAMRLVALDGTSEAYFKLGQLLPLRDPVTGLSWEFHRQQFHPDLEHEIHHPIDQRIYDGGNRSYICAPLIHQGQACGTLGIGSRQKNQYTRDDLEFLQEVANQIALAVANMRAYDEIKALSAKEAAMAERRRTLIEINNAIATKLTQQELCDAVFAALGRLVPFDRVGLSLFDYEEDCYHIIALGGALGGQAQSESFAIGQRISRQENWVTEQFSIGQPWFRPDLETVERNPFEQQLYDEGLRSFCAVPLLAQGKVIGAFSVSSQTRNQYSEADMELLQEVANQVAIAIANMRAYEEVAALNATAAAVAERRRTLLEINNAIITNLTKESLLGAICQTLERVLPFDLAGINLYEPETGDLRLVAMEGSYRSDYFSVGQKLDLSDSCAGEAFTSQRPALRRDMAIEGRYSSERRGVAEGFHSLCIVPLIAQGASIGCLALLGQKPNQYSSADAEFLQEVANQVALAIANMQAYEKIMALGEREMAMADRRRTLLEINNAIITRLNQNELLQAVADAISRLYPSDQFSFTLYLPDEDAFQLLAAAGDVVSQHLTPGLLLPKAAMEGEGRPLNLEIPLLIRDLEADRRTPFEDKLYAEGCRSFCAALFGTQGRIIGGLGVGSRDAGAYTETDAEFLQEVASQVALAVANMRLYEEMSQEATQRQRTEEMLRAITEGTAAATGVDFFMSLARHLATALQIRFALAAECIGRDKGRVRTLAFWQGDRFGDNFEYDLTDTPCKGVIEGKVCYYPSNVQNHFPNDADLRKLGAESYLGVTIFDTAGQAVGHLAVMDDKAMADDPWRVSVLKTFAARAGAELERLRAEMALRAALDQVESLKNRLQAENLYLQEEIRTEHNFDDIIGTSPALHAVLRQVEMIAPLDSAVLILGETGTGKELVARAIHDRGARKDRPLVKVNCGAISAGLVESELFGHVKGAFTGAVDKRVGRFELADGGTMFLDEVGELPMETQVKLLRVLQEGEFEPVGSNQTRRVNVRIIAATNRNLEEEIQKGRFRADLFYRLNVLPIQLPSLRQRMEDLPKLVMFFLSRFARKMGRKINGVSQETMERLKRYSWPGNVRELQNVIERAVALTSGAVLTLDNDLAPPAIQASLLDAQTNGHANILPASNSSSPDTGVSRSLEVVERDHILAVLEQTGWVVEGAKGAAKILSLNPNTLRSRMKKLGITRSNRHAGSTSI